MTATIRPHNCQICGNYLTTIDSYLGSRCLDPGHWQAAGLVTPRDFYSLAQIAAMARTEAIYRGGQHGVGDAGAGL